VAAIFHAGHCDVAASRLVNQAFANTSSPIGIRLANILVLSIPYSGVFEIAVFADFVGRSARQAGLFLPSDVSAVPRIQRTDPDAAESSMFLNFIIYLDFT
jgi:hypothetical protein